MDFLVFGAIEARSAGDRVPVGGVKQRSVLALLIANRGRPVSADRIVLEVHGEDAGPGARRSLQTVVSVLRHDLGHVISGTGDAYVLDVPRSSIDVCRFEDGVAEGLDHLAHDPERSAAVLSDALALWRGDPYCDVDALSVFHAETMRLVELRDLAVETRIEANLACGRHREILPEIEALAAEYPLRERLSALWMLALYRSGRQAEALRAYQRLRRILGEELGIEPSTELRTLEEQILLQDPDLDLVSPTPHNLPAALASFIGRSLELIEIGMLLEDARLITLTGAGGTGKTRLAVELARSSLDAYPDGAWFVDLRDIDDPTKVAASVASTLRVMTPGNGSAADQLAAALWSRRLLLILDNCEHVLEGVSPLVERLTRHDGAFRVLATSREPLGVPGESIVQICPLPVPEWVEIDELATSDAALLLSDRASVVMPDFVVEEHVEAVVEICRSVEGLPLGLELAAARLRVFSPEELAGRLGDQLGVLRTTLKAGDLRHATMEATIRWSWSLLDGTERTLLARLSVFRGTWSMAAVEAICGFGDIDPDQVPDVVSSLVTKSLVNVEGVSGGSTRYRLLEPLRQFSARQLDETATDHLRGWFVDYWAATVADMNDEFGVRDYEQAKTLEVDRANLTAAIEWALMLRRYGDAALILASPFGLLLVMRGSGFDFASSLMDDVLEHGDSIAHQVLVRAIDIVCCVAISDARDGAALPYANLAIEIARSPEERHWFELTAAVAMNRLGRCDEAMSMLDGIITESADPGMTASALLAKTEYEPPKQAWALAETAMSLAPIDSLKWWDEGVAAWLVGLTALHTGRYDVAVQMAERGVESCRETGWSVMACHAAALLAWVYTEMGRFDDADEVVEEALRGVRRILGPSITTFAVLWEAADLARRSGDLDRARACLEAAQVGKEQDEASAQIRSGTAYLSALIARDDHDLDRARSLLDDLPQCLDGQNPEYDGASPAEVRLAEASVEVRRSDPDRALEELRAVLAEPGQLSHSLTVHALDLAAIAFAQQGGAEVAARLAGAVDRERERTGLILQPLNEPIRTAALLDARAILGETWDETVAQGRAITLTEAFDLAAIEANVNPQSSGGVRNANDGASRPHASDAGRVKAPGPSREP